MNPETTLKMTFLEDELLQAAQALLQDFQQEDAGDAAEAVEQISQLRDGQIVLVAQQAQTAELLGFASLSHNSLHPQWVRPFVLVRPDARRQGIGTALHAALWESERYKLEAGFQAGCSDDNSAVQGFLSALGYSQRLHSDTLYFDLTPAADSQPALPALPAALQGQGLTVASFDSLKDQRPKLLGFLVERYTAEHAWSPPIAASHPHWKALVFDELDPQLSLAVLREGKLLAAATAEANEDLLDLIWAYASPDEAFETRVALLQLLLQHQCQLAHAQGLTEGRVEIDSSDQVLTQLGAGLELLESSRWQIYQKAKAAASAEDGQTLS